MTLSSNWLVFSARFTCLLVLAFWLRIDDSYVKGGAYFPLPIRREVFLDTANKTPVWAKPLMDSLNMNWTEIINIDNVLVMAIVKKEKH